MKKVRLWLDVEFDETETDGESLADAMERLIGLSMAVAKDTLDDYGRVKIGRVWAPEHPCVVKTSHGTYGPFLCASEARKWIHLKLPSNPEICEIQIPDWNNLAIPK